MTQASVRWVAVCSEPVLVQQSVPLLVEAQVPLLGLLPAARLARLRVRLRHRPRRNIRRRDIRRRDIHRRDIHRRDIHRRHTTGNYANRFRSVSCRSEISSSRCASRWCSRSLLVSWRITGRVRVNAAMVPDIWVYREANRLITEHGGG